MATTDNIVLWRTITLAGGIEGYINAKLKERGFLVERRDAKKLAAPELDDYKKALKAEAQERRKLQKECWEAYRANHIVHVGDGIHWTDRTEKDKWDLPNAEERAAENELPALDTPQQLAEALELSISELRWMAYHREAATKLHYVRFTIPKRNGKERAIWAPLPKLKKAQRWILRNIVEKLLVHGSVHGFLPGRSILSNASVHTNAKLVLKMDIQDFFPTVTYPRVKGIFRKAGYREQVATLLALLCTEAPREIVEHDGKKYYIAMGQRCLPQGAPTSPALTNTLCLRLDQRLAGLAKRYGYRYTRYADDLTFSLPETHAGEPKLGTLMGLVQRVVRAEGFAVHPDKTRVSRSGGRQKITGLVINGQQKPRVPRQLRRQLRAAIHNLKQGKPLKEGETVATLVGYAAYVTMMDRELGEKFLKELSDGKE